eukprot:CAMPEP_0175063026 /NCGR_PEP_ID=MMETSP0052_2-20121109/14510_1 /TAXON_ID=51329 ORGANISM="Polytomella parva, Strain SAG 63-3" /NCGR_SAMPLE_ID=MMETSP0052_2 /ASSEMBLY_ACC=CAM_ASM_000194 /LENGTH=186 /DNA_ID=CAMNT_0016329143 /DNA_START=197 /DNA_END=757 /DNA_ORIENTATION=+
MSNIFEQLIDNAASKRLYPENRKAPSTMLDSFEDHLQALSQTFENEILLNSLEVHAKAPTYAQSNSLDALTELLNLASKNHNTILKNERQILTRTRSLHSRLSIPIEPEDQAAFWSLLRTIYATGSWIPDSLQRDLHWLLEQRELGSATWHELLQPAAATVQLVKEYHDKLLTRQRLLGKVLTDVL